LEAEVRKEDIFYYYIKSFDREELMAAVRDAFKKMGKIREAKRINEPPSILVIDDDVNFVMFLKAVLASKGYDVDAAHNKAEAMRKLKSYTPDLILLDIMMEKLTDGFDICYKLKHDPQTTEIPVLAVSSITAQTGFKLSSATDGEYFEADDYLQKPVEPATLLGRVEKLLRG
jgi:DNA-binding response OmpR family regulator